MSTSLPPVKLPRNVYVDLYAATGITVGTELTVQNVGSSVAHLYESDVSPLPTTGFNVIDKLQFMNSATTPIGAWAMSPRSTTLQVEVA